MNKELLKKIRERFHEKLQAKTGWGKNDVIAEYDKAVTEILLEMLDQ